MKICQNNFRAEIHADQCNYKHKIEWLELAFILHSL
jgi:hypothetical protein